MQSAAHFKKNYHKSKRLQTAIYRVIDMYIAYMLGGVSLADSGPFLYLRRFVSGS